MKVLVVEDEGLIAAQLEAMLETAGYEVVAIAASAAQAVAAAEQYRPDIATVDVRLLHNDSGTELAHRLYRDHGIPSLMISAFNTEARPAQGAALGCLAKPFGARELLSSMRFAQAALRANAGLASLPRGLEPYDRPEPAETPSPEAALA